MKIIIKEVVFLLRAIFFVPHLLTYFFSPQKMIINEDVAAMCKTSINKSRKNLRLVYLLVNDKYFRKIFYNRIGAFSILLRWYAPGAETFIPCDNIGGGIYCAHPYATILNAKRIGRNLCIRQCTTIGNKYDGDKDNLPIIGDNVTIGSNVVIIGNVTIGNNCVIGAGSVVVKDVESNCIVAGNPARVVKIIE